MVNASHHYLLFTLPAQKRRAYKKRRAYDEQIIARPQPRVQPQRLIMVSSWCDDGTEKRPKKRAAVSGGFEVDNREASNRVDRSHSVSKRGQSKS
jgi:hypothetical protein